MLCYQESLRFAVLSFFVIFLLTGTALTSIGTIYELTFIDLNPTIPSSYQHLHVIPRLTITAGVATFAFAFIGCIGAIINSRYFLLTNVVLLITTFLFQLSTYIFATVQDFDDLSHKLNTTINTVFQNLNDSNFLTLVQSELKCCGPHGPDSWSNITNLPIPLSCCEDEACIHMYENGCYNAVLGFIMEATRVMGVTLLVVGVAEVAGAVLAAFMVWGTKRESKRGYLYVSWEEE